MTRSRFGFQTALLAGCLSLLAVGCGDDGTPQAMKEPAEPTPPADTPPTDPCVADPTGAACEAQKQEQMQAAREALPVFGLSEEYLLDTNELQIGGNKVLGTATKWARSNWGDTAPFTFRVSRTEKGQGIQIISHRPEAALNGAPYSVPLLHKVMRNDAGELTYSLDFYRYKNIDKQNADEDRVARRWTYGTWPAQSPDMLVDPLDREAGIDDATEVADLDFQINQGAMINDKLNLDYLADVGLGEDDGYTVHVLERKGVSYAGKSGTLYAEMITDHDQGKRDSDYLAAGVWMLIPDDGKADNFRTGVFADGGNYYGIGITRLLSGEVTYSGKAIGFHTMTGEKRVTQRLTGDVELTANFGDKEDSQVQMEVRGSVEGTISNIKLDGMDPAGTSSLIILPTITMNTIAEDTARGEDYSGENEFQTNPSVISLNGVNGLKSVGQIGGEKYMGVWGVAFYGEGHGDQTTRRTDNSAEGRPYANRAFDGNMRPSGLAGVVKGAAGNNRAFIASFIAKEE